MAEKLKNIKESSFQRSNCPISCVLDIIGDKWTLLIIRDLYLGKHRFSEIMASDEALKSNILAERLKRLERVGLLEKRAYQDRPVRYEYFLTGAGEDLGQLLREMILWSKKYLPGTKSLIKV